MTDGTGTLAGDRTARVRQAASGRTEPSELRALAHDLEVLVRAAVAINPSCVPDIDATLVGDDDARVRALLASRIARLLPKLPEQERWEASDHLRPTLLALARDEAVRVRKAIADAVKDMPEAPRELVLHLASDRSFVVSDPVIRLSPVLTDADLLALLATPPHPGTSVSIAGRAELSPALTDAIARHANAPAVQAMLANSSAAIREATLDGLIGKAPEHQAWHGPLVRRPALSGSAARALSLFVATQFLEVLAQRTDLDSDVVQSIRSTLSARLNNGQVDSEHRALIAAFLRLKKANGLDEAALLAAARTGEPRRVAAALTVACDLPLSTIERAVELRSARALVSLAWHAGFTMQAGAAIQTVLGQLPPAATLNPARDGSFPLSEDEMRWQLEILNDPAHKMGANSPRRSARRLSGEGGAG